jgi:type VI secretion system protein ImpF
MAKGDALEGFVPSIIDRLIDPDAAGTRARRGYGVEQMISAVRRDLEDLLNTRQTAADLPRDYHQVLQSIVGYGLPDLSNFNAITAQECDEIGRMLEAVIAQFEPRLKDVRALVLDPGDGKSRSVRFRIDARLRLEPSPDVAFDTILELTTGHYSVKPSGS